MNVYPSGSLIAGRFEVVGRPLMGGQGIVYLCIDREEQRPVALKTFRPELLPNRAARDRFLREGTHWVDLGAHPHIVCCYGVARIGHGTEVYLALELVAKEQGRADASLRSWLVPGRPLPAETALLFALQAARGMQYAVATIPGFVHRDLKPENLLVGADRLSGETAANRLRVTDFGLVRALGAGEAVAAVGEDEELPARPGLTRAGRILGTPTYMAPEQWSGPDVDLRADVYALGCILGEMLTGHMLVQERTLQGLRQAHQGGRAARITADLSCHLDGVLSRCLAVEPEERYGSWSEVGTAMGAAYRAVTGQPEPAPEPTAALNSGERVAAAWSYNAIGQSYLDLGQAKTALGYFDRARTAGMEEADRPLEAAGLNHLGLAHAHLGDIRRAIECHEQALAINRETCERSREGTLEWMAARSAEGAAIGNLGIAYEKLGDARRAIGYYEQQLATTREISDRHGEGNALGCLGAAYYLLGDAHRAISYYEQALIISREIGNRGGEGRAIGNLGIACEKLGNARQAIGYYEQAQAIFREVGDRRGEMSALGNLGNAYTVLGEARRAIDYHERALAISREIGDRRGEGVDLGNLGSAHRDLGDARRAIGYYKEQLSITRETGNRYAEGVALGNLGVAYKDLGDARRAIGYYEQALAIARKIGDRRGEGIALGNLGGAYKDLGDARRAIGYCEQGLTIHRESGNRHGEGNTLRSLGTAYTALGQTSQSIGYFEQALAISREIDDRHGEGADLDNLGLAYAELGDAHRAIGYYEQALKIHREIRRAPQSEAERTLARRREGKSLGNLGVAYKKLGDACRAIGYYEQQLIIAREVGDRHGERNALGNMGSAHTALGQARQSIGFFEQALAISREISDRREEGADLNNLGLAYAELGDARRAIGYYEQALKIHREIRRAPQSEAERMSARRGEGSALGNLGIAYKRLGDARRAIGYYEQQLIIGREVGDRHGEGNALGNMGNAYLELGNACRAIGYYEQSLTIREEIGDLMGMATDSFNLALLYARKVEPVHALPHAQRAAQILAQAGHAQRAEQAEQLLGMIQSLLR
jgi:tetratricopeptide (TPR) repeat protein